MSDPFAAARAQLKASKPHVVTSTATPSKTATPASSTSKTDPLAALRAQVKAGKGASTPASTAKVDLSKLNVADRLNRLEVIAQALLTASPDAAKIQKSLAALKPATESARF